MDINSKYIKSYSTKENLAKALKKNSIDDHRHVVVCNDEGRFTAIFFFSELARHQISYMGFYGQYGFMVIG